MIQFAPLLPWPVLAALVGLSLVVGVLALVRRARGALLRLCGFLLLVTILAGPHLVQATRRSLPDIALVVVDQSQSMTIGRRTQMAQAAQTMIQAQAAQIPGLQLRVVDLPAAAGGGTALFAAIGQALQTIPPAQLAGVVAVTDGQIADVPAKPAFDAPLTALLTAKPKQTDRELRLLAAPAYGLVGKTISVQLEVFDHGGDDPGTLVALTMTEDGEKIWSGRAIVGTPLAIDIPVRHAGPAVVTAAVAPLPGEISAINDQAAFTLNGIARKLEVLLISGNPNPSERTWRSLLKSDPAVELVHFTILRTPDESLDAAPDEVALVPFPVQQLFVTDIGKFDLIILDQFNAAGLLPPAYLGNIATYVQNGGALLTQVGPEFAQAGSLAESPLAPVLPAAPAPPGTLAQNFAPTVTDLGARHPVTAPFAAGALAPWDRLETTAASGGDVLMTGPDDWPLLVLADEGKGRSGLLLSDQFWLWTRGGAHDGPAVPLLRRVVHWLLREPALEAEALNADIDTGSLTITRQTLSATYPGDAALTAPDGAASTIAMHAQSPGAYSARLPGAAEGVWKISEGGLTTYAVRAAANAEEFQDLAASAAPLRAVANIVWLGDTPRPDLSAMLHRRHATEVLGTRDIPLLPALPAMAIALALLAGAWWRERG